MRKTAILIFSLFLSIAKAQGIICPVLLLTSNTLLSEFKQPKYSIIDSDYKTVKTLSIKFEKKVLIDARNASIGSVIKIKERHKYIILPFKFWDKKGLMKILILGDNCEQIKFNENFILINGRDTYSRTTH